MKIKLKKIEREILELLKAHNGAAISDEIIAKQVEAPLFIVNRILFDIRKSEQPLVETCLDDDKTACHRYITDNDDRTTNNQNERIIKTETNNTSKLVSNRRTDDTEDLSMYLSLIKENMPISKREFQDISKLSLRAASKIIEKLAENNMITINQMGRKKIISLPDDVLLANKSSTEKQSDRCYTSLQLDQILIKAIAKTELTQSECVRRLSQLHDLKHGVIIRHFFNMESRGLVSITEEDNDLLFTVTDNGLDFFNYHQSQSELDSVILELKMLKDFKSAISTRISTILESINSKTKNDPLQDLETITQYFEEMASENSKYKSIISTIKDQF